MAGRIVRGVALGGLFVLVYVKGKALFPDRAIQMPEQSNTQQVGSPALRQLHVHLRNRVAVAAGGDHRRGGDGEEEDLAAENSRTENLRTS